MKLLILLILTFLPLQEIVIHLLLTLIHVQFWQDLLDRLDNIQVLPKQILLLQSLIQALNLSFVSLVLLFDSFLEVPLHRREEVIGLEVVP